METVKDMAILRPGNWFARLDYARRIGSDEFMYYCVHYIYAEEIKILRWQEFLTIM